RAGRRAGDRAAATAAAAAVVGVPAAAATTATRALGCPRVARRPLAEPVLEHEVAACAEQAGPDHLAPAELRLDDLQAVLAGIREGLLFTKAENVHFVTFRG